MQRASVDLMYLACNRLEFTQETFTTLLVNTDWDLVHEFFVYDDGSTDGTREWLETAAAKSPVTYRFLETGFGSPVTAMSHFIESARAPILAKIDNDAMMPADWLQQSLAVLDRHPRLSFLGLEAMCSPQEEMNSGRSYVTAQFISGLGLYRRQAFARSRPQAFQKWFGFEEWQRAQGPGLIRGWIKPALPVFLLDRLPLAPWSDLTEAFVRKGWQRPWPKYDPESGLWNWKWPKSTRTLPPNVAPTPSTGNGKSSHRAFNTPEDAHAGPGFKVVILSAQASNLVPCVQSILRHEPDLPPEHIIVVDDGARPEAEAQLPSLCWLTGAKPFNFARNANLGLRHANADAILLNDDARLVTDRGFTLLSQQVKSSPRIGLCSAGVQGVVCNANQIARRAQSFRTERRMLAFVCVYISRAIYEILGPLDERFAGYGFEDNDYCARVVAKGLQLAIWDGCVVDHSGAAPSTFRTRPDWFSLFERNRSLYMQKWGRLI